MIQTELGLRKLKSMIYKVLERREETRNSDIALTIQIWKIYFPSKILKDAQEREYVLLDSLYDLPREDDIKRLRAVYQNTDGIFLPTDQKIREARKINENKWFQWVQKSKMWGRAIIQDKLNI